jgi:hypothetical protein
MMLRCHADPRLPAHGMRAYRWQCQPVAEEDRPVIRGAQPHIAPVLARSGPTLGVLLCAPEDFGTGLKSAKGAGSSPVASTMTESRSQFPGRTRAKSDAQSFLVDVFYPLVGPSKTIPGVVDLLLG